MSTNKNKGNEKQFDKYLNADYVSVKGVFIFELIKVSVKFRIDSLKCFYWVIYCKNEKNIKSYD